MLQPSSLRPLRLGAQQKNTKIKNRPTTFICPVRKTETAKSGNPPLPQ